MSEGASLLPQLIPTLGATLGAFGLGNVLVWSASALTDIEDEGDLVLSTSQQALVGSIFSIGAAVVPLFAALLMPRIGKKWFLISLAFPFIAGWVVLLLAKTGDVSSHYWMLLLGRLLTGFAGGAFVIAAPSYVADLAETKYRGALATMMQLMVTLGILFMNVLCGQVDWQLLSGIAIIFPVLMVVWMFFMPRSPVYLINKGQTEEARKALQAFRGKSAKIDAEFQQMEDDIMKTKEIGSIGLSELFTKPEYLKPMGISLALMAFQQLSGINYVMAFSTIIFEDAGSSLSSCVSTMILGVIQVVFTGVASLVVDRFGRKILLVTSDLTMTIAMVGMAVFFKFKEGCKECEEDDDSTTTTLSPDVFVEATTVDSLAGWLPLVSMMTFIAGFAVGFGPLPWVMNVELMPPEARNVAASFCTSFNWTISFLVAFFIPQLGEAINPSNTYIIFAVICAIGTAFVIFIVPETKGKSESEIRELFSSKGEKEKESNQKS